MFWWLLLVANKEELERYKLLLNHKSQVMKFKRTLCMLFVFIMASSCFPNSRDANWLSCKDSFDTLEIKTENNHGTWTITTEEIVLSGILKPFDRSDCDKIGYRIKPILTPKGTEYSCKLGDLKPPFRVFKKSNSDTLNVIYSGRLFYFQIPKVDCE